MKEKPVEKIIGWVYCMIDSENMAAVDIYEGNYIKLMNGGALTRTAARKQDYDRAVVLYEECVKNDEMISTAYEQNQKLGLDIRIPEITADPKAAEREWEIRKSPQIVHYEEPEKKRRFAIGQRKKERIAIRCLACGEINPKGQRFCGFCGEVLQNEEFPLNPLGEEEKGENETRLNEKKTEEEAPYEKTSQENKNQRGIKASREDFQDSSLMPGEEHAFEGHGMRGGEGGRNGDRYKGFVKAGLIFLSAAAFVGIGIWAFLFLNQPKEVLYDSDMAVKELPYAMPTEGYVAVKLVRDLPANTQITGEDIEGIILSGDQFQKYSQTGTYIDEKGQVKNETLLMWEGKDEIIGQYTARELAEGSLLYDTSITPLHVVSDKTYVEVDVDGEGKIYQADKETLPGNTRIQIVAVIQTDAGEPKQVLLSEMTLKDRSLESIFDAAGQDILDMLSGEQAGKEDTEVENEETDGNEEGNPDKNETEAVE